MKIPTDISATLNRKFLARGLLGPCRLKAMSSTLELQAGKKSHQRFVRSPVRVPAGWAESIEMPSEAFRRHFKVPLS